MAVLVSAVVDAVLAAVDSECGPQLVAGWVSERYRELTNRARMRHLLKVGELVMPAVVTAGLVTVTSGEKVVEGDTDARTAWAAVSASIVGRYIRIAGQSNWFRVAGLTSDNDILLETPYVLPFSGSDDPIEDSAYVLAVRFHRLAEGMRHMGIVRHPRLRDPLDEIDHQELDQAMAGRVLVADIPRFWCEAGVDVDGRKLIEIYPYARTDQLIQYSYTAASPALTLDSVLPDEIDLHVLKVGALIDVYRWESTQALRKNQPDVAGHWRNEMNTLTTRWDDKIREAVKADRASDVLSFQYNAQGFPSHGRTIRDARDYVWARAVRP